MKDLLPLATAALLGTERRAPEFGQREDGIGELIGELGATQETVETKLLQMAGVLALCGAAGGLPTVVKDAPVKAGEDRDLRQNASEALSQVLGGIFADGPERLQVEALQRLKRAGLALPYRWLPLVLDGGRKSVALREFLLPVLGARGAWLAAQNADWKFAAGGEGDAEDESMWIEGSLDQRRLYLSKLRERDAAGGRKLVEEALKTEGARERGELLACLEIGLEQADEDLLEQTLRDKSKEVKSRAVRMLSALPGSRYGERMAERLKECISIEKKFLRGTVVKIEPPKEYGAGWKEDMIEEKAVGRKIGERAWWLLQMVQMTPLDWWTKTTGMSPLDLVEWAEKSDWKGALIEGWVEAQKLQKNVEWGEALLERNAVQVMAVIHTFPSERRERHFLKAWKKELDGRNNGYAMSSLLSAYLDELPLDGDGLSEAGARSILDTVKQRVNSGAAKSEWMLREVLVNLACVIPPTLFDESVKGWQMTKEEVQGFAEALARMEMVVERRRALQTLDK